MCCYWHMKRINTIADLFKEFDEPNECGEAVLARKCGIGRTAAKNWRLRGSIPGRHHMKIYQMASERGIELSPDLIGLDDCIAA